jgi:uncharacterized protein (DUF983 family)
MENIKSHFWADIKTALSCTCPRCKTGHLYPATISLNLNDKCPNCGLNLAKNDSADGPAVFLIFILGFLLVPLALLFEFTVHPPLWVHAVLWTVVALALTLGALKPLKAFIIALQFRHRPGDWS